VLRVIENFRARLNELLPTRPNGNAISAWNEFASFTQELHERVLTLEGAHPVPEPEPEPEPEPPPGQLAPRTYNKSSKGDALFCIEGLPRNTNGEFFEPSNPNIRYDENGKSLGGAPGDTRDPDRIVPAIKGSDMTDGRGPCESYEWMGRVFPPWPPESYLL
jgi:hypothetical protein